MHSLKRSILHSLSHLLNKSIELLNRVSKSKNLQPMQADSNSPVQALKTEYNQKLDTLLCSNLILALEANDFIETENLIIVVKNQVAHLYGNLETKKAKELCHEIAFSIEGIERVKNNILTDENSSSATPSEVVDSLKDTAVLAMVKLRLNMSKNLHIDNMQVRTESGFVYLRGEVSTEEEKNLAETVCINVKSVKAVVNELSVSH